MERNLATVIDEIISAVPKGYKPDAIRRILNIKNSVGFTAPELMHIRWGELQASLYNLLPEVTSSDPEWKFKVWSIFTTMTVEEVKAKLISLEEERSKLK